MVKPVEAPLEALSPGHDLLAVSPNFGAEGLELSTMRTTLSPVGVKFSANFVVYAGRFLPTPLPHTVQTLLVS